MYTADLPRMTDKIATFAKFGDAGHGGITRYTLSPADLQARHEFIRRMQAIGAGIEIDDLANIYATLPGSDPGAKRIVTGSHCDSVKQGGNYDGILGVLAAMEVLETVASQNIPHRHPLTAMIWTNEEGSLYPPAMMASGIVCNPWLPASIKGKFQEADMLRSRDIVDGQDSFGAALERSGFKGDPAWRLSPERYQALFELHIEQGPILEDSGKDIGVVDCVLGMFNYRLRFYGQTVHAGTFPMAKRHDALFAASQALVHLHQAIDALGRPELVYTTGEMVCQPGVHTCVPSYVDFSLDVRHQDPAVLEQVLGLVQACAAREWAGCRCQMDKMWNRDTVYFDPTLVGYVEAAAREAGTSWQRVPSGAGHDAQFAAYMLPATMIFVPSKDGISHNEAEFTSAQACTTGATVLLNAILKADQA